MPRGIDLEEEKGYKIIKADKAKKEIKVKDKALEEQINKKIKGLKNLPSQKGKAMKGEFHPNRQVKVGKYRVIYEVKQEEKKVEVKTVKHKDKIMEKYH